MRCGLRRIYIVRSRDLIEDFNIVATLGALVVLFGVEGELHCHLVAGSLAPANPERHCEEGAARLWEWTVERFVSLRDRPSTGSQTLLAKSAQT
jgi:hypothetical protein